MQSRATKCANVVGVVGIGTWLPFEEEMVNFAASKSGRR